jgi:DNA adenine methylase
MVTSRKIAAIPRYGSKFRLARYIVPIIEAMPHKTYIEPCVGGASVFLWRSPDTTRGEVLNDINQDIYALYRAFKLHPEAVLRQIDSMPYSESLYQECKAIRGRGVVLELPPEELCLRAAASYYHFCTTFGNIDRPSGLNKDAAWRVKFPTQWTNKQNLLPTLMPRFKSVHLEACDILDCLQRWDSPTALFYIDPPYADSDCAGYDAPPFDAMALRSVLDSLQGGWVLSGYATTPIPLRTCLIAERRLRNSSICSSNRHKAQAI